MMSGLRLFSLDFPPEALAKLCKAKFLACSEITIYLSFSFICLTFNFIYIARESGQLSAPGDYQAPEVHP